MATNSERSGTVDETTEQGRSEVRQGGCRGEIAGDGLSKINQPKNLDVLSVEGEMAWGCETRSNRQLAEQGRPPEERRHGRSRNGAAR